METETNYRILIVDDTPENIDILGDVLSEYQISIALNGEKALKLAFGPVQPDLILLDVIMPGITGYEVISRLKESELTRQIPVIFITSLSDTDNETKGFALGAADYITKPFQPDIVRARVRTQLLLQAQQKALHRLNGQLYQNNVQLEEARSRADKLLHSILPESVIADLEQFGKTEPKMFEAASVLFVDIVGFSRLASQIAPALLIEELNEIFTAFDDIIATYDCERIKTIGDGYMAVCGVPNPNPKHAQLIISAAIEFLGYIMNRNRSLPEGRHAFDIRLGINSGSLIAGIVGTKKYIYDVFGDTVNIASRMESHGDVMRIAISGSTYELVRADYQFDDKGVVEIKGIGGMQMYLLDEKYTRYL